MLRALDLTDRAGTRVGSLSGGERKRASIAVDLLTRPGILFLDEPTSGLDPATAADFMRLLRRLAAAGSTVVLTTHNPPDVALCDEVAFLVEGRLAFHGTPDAACAYFQTDHIEEVYERLADEDTPRSGPDRFARAAAASPDAGAAPACVRRRDGPARTPTAWPASGRAGRSGGC